MQMFEFLISDQEYNKDDIILDLGNIRCDSSDARRIQLGESDFILPPAIIYHSCEPNSYIDWGSLTLKAKGRILLGETITYHYGTSEDDYQIGKFECKCGSPNCLKEFKGFKYMQQEDRVALIYLLSPFLKKKYFENF